MNKIVFIIIFQKREKIAGFEYNLDVQVMETKFALQVIYT